VKLRQYNYSLNYLLMFRLDPDVYESLEYLFFAYGHLDKLNDIMKIIKEGLNA
jgi:hypothetical protein